MAEGKFTVQWVDLEREPQCEPNPAYPDGVDVDVSFGLPACSASLPYPAKRCGFYRVKCQICGLAVGVTAAGRVDDPRSITIPCRTLANG